MPLPDAQERTHALKDGHIENIMPQQDKKFGGVADT